MNSFATKGKQTIWVSFVTMPDIFEVYRNGKLYFFRILDGKYSTIKFNVCHEGNYTTNVQCTTLQILPLTIHPLKYTLPPHEREKIKPYKVIRNYELLNTPARNFVEKGIIETGADFEKYPQPVQRFILLHEEGHFIYKTEEFCDIYAAQKYIAEGYNNSMAYYALTKVLRHNAGNQKRIEFLFKHLHR